MLPIRQPGSKAQVDTTPTVSALREIVSLGSLVVYPWYTTRLLVKLEPKGAVFSFLFIPEGEWVCRVGGASPGPRVADRPWALEHCYWPSRRRHAGFCLCPDPDLEQPLEQGCGLAGHGGAYGILWVSHKGSGLVNSSFRQPA